MGKAQRLMSGVRRAVWTAGVIALSLGLLLAACAAYSESPALSATSRPSQPEEKPAQAPATLGPSDQPAGVAVTLRALVERLERADQAMREVRSAPDLAGARRAARAVLDLLTGPSGRHSGPSAVVPGVLPADGPTLSEPGLALAAYQGSADPRVRTPIADVILGDADAWQRPTARWDEIDRAVAGWTSQHNPMPTLDGHVMRVVGWALLAERAPSVERAREHASHGVIHTSLSLEAAREALAAACAGADGAECEPAR